MRGLTGFRQSCAWDVQASDTRTIVQQLMTCVKTLMYSLSKFGNTTPVLTAAVPGGPPVSSFGMREEELRLASKAVVNSVPCLRIFCAPYRNMDREIGIYDLFAEMVSSLPVRANALELSSLKRRRMIEAI